MIEHYFNNNITYYVPQLNQAKSSTTPAIKKKQGIETREKGGTTNGSNKVRSQAKNRSSVAIELRTAVVATALFLYK